MSYSDRFINEMTAAKSGSRKANKERTRQKLIQAMLEVLHKQGASALTTGRIAAEAGVAQPTFYVHFNGMDDALSQTAAQVAEESLQNLIGFRSAVGVGSPIEMIRYAFSSSVDKLMERPQLTELYLRHRLDVDSPLGRGWTEITNKARADLTEDLERMSIPEARLFAEMIVSQVIGVVEGLLHGRIVERDAAIEMMVLQTVLTVNHYLVKREPKSAVIALE